ncbi:MAG: hypothetical protein JO131_07275, partial [Gammaproteobacteria bacterium]|nr:hypothetical protein [Gammaproteobacteria bacterium]
LTTAQSLIVSNYAGWNITNVATNPGGSTVPSTPWLVFNGTRPVLSAEWATNITNPHQLQLAGAALGANYTLGTNIDFSNTLNNPADIWGGGSFSPIGNSTTPFSGNFNGQGFIINALYINAPTQNAVGLFGHFSSGVIQNMSVTNANVIGQNITGILVGQMDSGTINTSYTSGSVTGSFNGTGNSGVGGLVGLVGSTGAINNTYSIASVTVSGSNADSAGGLVGSLMGGGITDSYSSGLISGTGIVTRGSNGLLGYFGTGSTVTDSFWDTQTSGQNGSAGSSGVQGYLGMTTAQMLSPFSFTDSSYGFVNTPWNINEQPIQSLPQAEISTPLNTVWSQFATRPMLNMEWTTSIQNAHQLEFVNGALAANYTLGANIDASATGNNAADVWGTNTTNNGAGFVPIGNIYLVNYAASYNPPAYGTSINFYFEGNFNGQGHTINGLTINSTNVPGYQKAATTYGFTSIVTGLFGTAASSGRNITLTIQNFGLTNVNIIGGDYTGGIAGVTQHIGPIILSQVYVTGTITGNPNNNNFGNGGVGGLIGHDYLGSIINSYSTATIINPTTQTMDNNNNMGLSVGGLVGIDFNSTKITNSYSSGQIISNPSLVNSNVAGIINNDFLSSSSLNNYWDTQTSGISATTGVANEATGLTTAQAMTQSSYINWDFNNVWYMVNGFTRPILRSQFSTTISNAMQLELSATQQKIYSLTQNIDLSTLNPNASSEFSSVIPVGNSNQNFTGFLNGHGYSINNLSMNVTSNIGGDVGLFGNVGSTAIIANLNINNGQISISNNSSTNVGLLAGSVSGTALISDINVSGSITSTAGNVQMGGLVGALNAGVLQQSTSSATISLTYNGTSSFANVGGMLGYNGTGGTVIQMASTVAPVVTLTGSTPTDMVAVGGLVGSNAGLITQSDNIATLQIPAGNDSNFEIGGLVGQNSNTILDSYNLGAVNASYGNIGGLLGYNAGSGTVSQSYSQSYVNVTLTGTRTDSILTG